MIIISLILFYLLEGYFSKLRFNKPKIDIKKNMLVIDESLIKIFLEDKQPEPAF